jgi:hypothetical protein
MPQQQVQGESTTSLSDAAADAASKIEELPGDQQVTFVLTRTTVTVGGQQGGTTYKVELDHV